MSDRDHLTNIGLGDVTQTRLYNRGAKPGITTPEIVSRSHDTQSKFVPPLRQPNNDQKKLMIKLAMECLLRTSLDNHIYSFNGQIKLQSSGGAIGDSLTGSIASVYVIHWCREFKQKLQNVNIIPEILKVYVDDETIVSKPTPPGAKYVNNELIIDEEQLNIDRDLPADIRTAKVYQSIANTVCDFL